MEKENKIKEIANRIINYIYRKHPIMFTTIFVVISLGYGVRWFFGMSPYQFIVRAYDKVIYLSQKEESTDNIPEKKVLGESVGLIECKFDDDKKWIGKDQFFSQDNVYMPNITENFSEGREMFCNEKIGSNFNMSLKFTPINEKKVNVSINYGYIWRVIIGNGDYNQIQAQINSRYPEQDLRGRDWTAQGKDWVRRNGFGLKKRNQIEVTIVSKASGESRRKVHLDVTVRGTAEGLMDSQEKYYNFDVQLPEDSEKLDKNIGVGIIDSKQEGVKVKFDNPLLIQKTEI